MHTELPTEPDVVDALTRVLVRSCGALAEAGQPGTAGRLAGQAWVMLRAGHPRQARHLDGVMHHIARLERTDDTSTPATKEHAISTSEPVLDVRSEIPKRRHELIFDTFASLPLGSAYELINDHDPKPLYYQLQAEHPGEFSWHYLEEGPEVWRVRIGRTAAARDAS